MSLWSTKLFMFIRVDKEGRAEEAVEVEERKTEEAEEVAIEDETGNEHRGAEGLAVGGGNDEAMQLLQEEIKQLKKDAKREQRDKRELVAKNKVEKGALVVKYVGEQRALLVKYEGDQRALVMKHEGTERKVRAELERSIASEKQLQRELAITKEPMILDIVQAYCDARDDAKLSITAPLLDLYDRIVSSSISDAKLRREIKCVADNKHGITVLHIAALGRFPYAALSRLAQCGCDIDAKNRYNNTAIMDAAKYDAPAVFDSLALLSADLSVKDANGKDVLQLTE
jgi:hypothetical protein